MQESIGNFKNSLCLPKCGTLSCLHHKCRKRTSIFVLVFANPLWSDDSLSVWNCCLSLNRSQTGARNTPKNKRSTLNWEKLFFCWAVSLSGQLPGVLQVSAALQRGGQDRGGEIAGNRRGDKDQSEGKGGREGEKGQLFFINHRTLLWKSLTHYESHLDFNSRFSKQHGHHIHSFEVGRREG